MTTQQFGGMTLIVLLFAALAWTCWCWARAEYRQRLAEHQLEAVLTGVITLNMYQVMAMRTAKPQDDQDAADHALFGVGSEVGELMTHWKAHRYYGKALDREYMLKEFGDLLWFLQRGAGALGFTLEQVASANLAKLRARYPEMYSNAAAVARADEHADVSGRTA